MLNKDGNRELAYVVTIDDIVPIEGSDNCECAVVGGWHIMVRKNTFQAGDTAVYFEIDSKLDETNPAFAFLQSRKYRVKTQKYTFGGKGNFVSQGLLLSAEECGLTSVKMHDVSYIMDIKGGLHSVVDETRFLTEILKVTYYVAEDNSRKANPDKYQGMNARHKKLLSKFPFSWLKKREWGRKILFFFFGRKADKKNAWPVHICAKTDVERIQNMAWILKDKQPYVATEKVDGSSCTIAAERKKFGKIKYYICSRNVVFQDEKQTCYYPTNIYFAAYFKYNVKEKITKMLQDLKLDNIAIQMEIYGKDVQKRDYSTKEYQAAVFHIVSNQVKFPMDEVVRLCEKYDLPHVPIIDDNFTFPDTIEELQTYVESAPSLIDGKPKEGIVFYDKQTGQTYTKFVSPEYLLKYHS